MSTIDSLNIKVNNSVGEEKTSSLIELMWEYRNIDPLKSIEYSNNAFSLLENYPNQKQLGTLYNVLGVVNTIVGNYDQALSYHFKSLKIREKIKGKNSIAASYNNIALVYQAAKNYDKALEYFYKSLDIKTELNNKIAMALTLNNIGSIFRLNKNFNKALEYHEKAFLMVKQLNDPNVLSLTYQGMGFVYSDLGNHSLAIEYFNSAFKLLDDMGNIQGSANLLNSLATEYFNIGDYKSSIESAQKSIDVSIKSDAKPQLSISYNLLAQIYSIQKDYKKALQYQLLYSQIQGKMYNAEQNKHLVEIQTRYENEKQFNKIKTLELEQQKSFRNILYLGSFIFFLAAIIVFQRYRYGLKTNRALMERNRRIETLYKLSEAVNASRDIKEFYKLVHLTISELLPAKNFYIAIYDEDKQTIRFPYFVDEKDTDLELKEFKPRGFKRGLTEYLISKGELVLLNKLSIEKLNADGLIDIIGVIPSEWLGVPLIDEKEKIIGALVVQTYNNESKYEEKDKELLSFVSAQIAMAIERKKAQAIIFESEQRFRMLADNVPGIIYLCKNDRNFTMVYLNDQIKKITGYSKALFLTEKLSLVNLYHPDDLDYVYNEVDSALQEGRPYHLIFRLKHQNGDYIWLEEHGSSLNIIGEDGNLLLEGFIQDITQRKNDEEKLILSKEQAEKSDKLKSEFLAQMSHEIRTPINTILSFSSLLREELEDKVEDDLKSSFVSMANAGKRIIRTIDLILNMSEVQTGVYDYVSRYVDVSAELLDPVRNEYVFAAAEKGLKLNVNILTDELYIWVDEYTLGQIVNNLVDNSIKYTPEGSIDINIFRNSNNRLVIEVKDTGIGMSADYLPSLFQTFSQEEQGYTRKFEGNGLGLALVKKYCELNNADIEVESEKCVGTIFRIIFA
ncbi:MAG: tetratricopeptide repeat protein [bacterium]